MLASLRSCITPLLFVSLFALYATPGVAATKPIAPTAIPSPTIALRVALQCAGLAKAIVQVVSSTNKPFPVAIVLVNGIDVESGLEMIAYRDNHWVCVGEGGTPTFYRPHVQTWQHLAQRFDSRLTSRVITPLTKITPASYRKTAPYMVHVIHDK